MCRAVGLYSIESMLLKKIAQSISPIGTQKFNNGLRLIKVCMKPLETKSRKRCKLSNVGGGSTLKIFGGGVSFLEFHSQPALENLAKKTPCFRNFGQ